MPFWRSFGEMNAGWARGSLHDAEQGAADIRRALAERVDQGAGFELVLYRSARGAGGEDA